MQDIAAGLWSALGGDLSELQHLELVGERPLLPSLFDVSGLATAAVGVATLAVAELQAVRAEREVEPVTVTTREASAGFRCETLFAPQGWDLPPVWDPIAGDYQGIDGWIRLHTNYAHHRGAVLRACGLDAANRETLAARVASFEVNELELRVIEEGGAAAAMRTRNQWLQHPQGMATTGGPPIEVVPRRRASSPSLTPDTSPLGGVRVLDLTRVIAGPFATRFLAAWGAEVLRVDPPGFEEVAAIVPESSAGKHCAFVNLGQADGRARLLDLVSQADVLVHGYRPGALDRLGFDHSSLLQANADLIISQHDAYGWTGPWAARRGFDSLVQMSCGIAAAAGTDRPQPLPAQALDHTTAMLIAAAVCRAVTARIRTGAPSDIRGSLVGVANFLYELQDPTSMSVEASSFGIDDTELLPTWWGPARAVPVPGRIGHKRPRLAVEPGPLGRHDPAFSR